jgi:quaternary ammonium compound-resistance protein SugE
MHARGIAAAGARRPQGWRCVRGKGEGNGRVRIGGEWIWLDVVGLPEVVWTILLKYTEGFTRLAPSLATVAAMAMSFYRMSRALQALPIGRVHAAWAGAGAAGAAIWGMAVEGIRCGATRPLPGADARRLGGAELAHG